VEEKDQEHCHEEKLVDGGRRAWAVVLASFLCNMLIDGIGYSFGVLLHPIQKEFKEGAASVSFVGSLLAGVIMLTGPIAAIAVDRVGPRLTCIGGSIIASLALFFSSTSSSLLLLIIYYGVIGGLGLGFMFVPAVISVGQYFDRRLSLATGIVTCGSGVGTFVFAPLTASLVQRFGWRGCNQAMALLCCSLILCGLVMAPGPNSRGRSQMSLFESVRSMAAVARKPAMILICLGNVLDPMAIYITYTYLPSMAESYLNFTSSQSSLLISSVGVANTVGRIFSGWLTDLPQVSALVVTLLSTCLAGVFPALLPLSTSYPLLTFLCACFGFILSAIPAVTTRLLVDLMGRDQLNSSFGVLTFVRGVAVLMGPPLAGRVMEQLSDQAAPFTLSSIFLLAATFMYAGVWVLNKRLTAWRPRDGYSPI